MDNDEALFLAQLNAKDGALDFLRSQYEHMKNKLVHSLSRANGSDIRQYSSLIHDAECNVIRKSRQYESMDGKEMCGISLTPMINTQEDFVGWNIEEHFKETAFKI